MRFKMFLSTCNNLVQCPQRQRQMILVISFLVMSSLVISDQGDIEQDTSSYMPDLELDGRNAVRRGREKLQDYASRISPCWMEAVTELRSKCSQMTDIERSILAMKFANCHFKKSGLTTYDCTDEKTFLDCTSCMKTVDSSSFLVYTEFFTHVTDICFYLQSEAWRQKTVHIVSQLSQATENTISKLDQSLNIQDTVLDLQNKSLINQQIIVESAQHAKYILDSLNITLKIVFDETKQQIEGKATKAFNKFEKVSEIVRKVEELQLMFSGSS